MIVMMCIKSLRYYTSRAHTYNPTQPLRPSPSLCPSLLYPTLPIKSLSRQVGTVNRRFTWLSAHCARERSKGRMEGEKEKERWRRVVVC